MTQPLTHDHPWWCEFPDAPADATHSHTRAVGIADLDDAVSVDAVVVQGYGEAAVLDLHVVTGQARLTLAADAGHAWLLAGMLVDATVLLRQVAASQAPPLPPAGTERPTRSGELTAVARRHAGRHPRRVRRSFRCPALPTPPDAPSPDNEPEW